MQVGLIPGGGVLLDNAQLGGAVDDGKGLREQVSGARGVFCCKCATHRANLVAKTGLVLAVHFGTACFRPDAFDG